MKPTILFQLFLVSGLTAGLAQTVEPGSAASVQRNRLSLGFDAGFNVRAEFRNFTPDVAPPPATGSGLNGDPVNREYEDGYNRVDFFNNGRGLTWNWGYDNAAQYNPVDRTLALHSTARTGYGASADASDDPQLGFELKYGRVLGILGENKPWGFEAAFGYMNLSIQDDSALSTAQRITDTYALGVVIPPPAPYQGTFNGPGPLIPDQPTRSIETAAASGRNELDGNLFALRLGPFLEVPLSRKFVSQFGLGLSLIYADTDYSYRETATFADGTSFTDSASDSASDLLVGGYLQGQLGYAINPSWSVLAVLRIETASGLTVEAGQREAELELGATFHALLGVGYSF
jgi:hypothetical protein